MTTANGIVPRDEARARVLAFANGKAMNVAYGVLPGEALQLFRADLIALLDRTHPVDREAIAREIEGLRAVCQQMADDYQVSANHHPDHVLVRSTDFNEMCARLRTLRIAEMHASSGGRAQTLKSATADDTPHLQAAEPEPTPARAALHPLKVERQPWHDEFGRECG